MSVFFPWYYPILDELLRGFSRVVLIPRLPRLVLGRVVVVRDLLAIGPFLSFFWGGEESTTLGDDMPPHMWECVIILLHFDRQPWPNDAIALGALRGMSAIFPRFICFLVG